MARNFVQPGDTLTLTAPYDVASGGGVLVGVIFGVATIAAQTGSPVEAARFGVWDLPKAAGQSWVAFTTKLYWDNTNKVVTSTVGTNLLIGVAGATQASADTVGRVILVPEI